MATLNTNNKLRMNRAELLKTLRDNDEWETYEHEGNVLAIPKSELITPRLVIVRVRGRHGNNWRMKDAVMDGGAFEYAEKVSYLGDGAMDTTGVVGSDMAEALMDMEAPPPILFAVGTKKEEDLMLSNLLGWDRLAEVLDFCIEMVELGFNTPDTRMAVYQEDAEMSATQYGKLCGADPIRIGNETIFSPLAQGYRITHTALPLGIFRDGQWVYYSEERALECFDLLMYYLSIEAEYGPVNEPFHFFPKGGPNTRAGSHIQLVKLPDNTGMVPCANCGCLVGGEGYLVNNGNSIVCGSCAVYKANDPKVIFENRMPVDPHSVGMETPLCPTCKSRKDVVLYETGMAEVFHCNHCENDFIHQGSEEFWIPRRGVIGKRMSSTMLASKERYCHECGQDLLPWDVTYSTYLTKDPMESPTVLCPTCYHLNELDYDPMRTLVHGLDT